MLRARDCQRAIEGSCKDPGALLLLRASYTLFLEGVLFRDVVQR